MLSHEFQSEPQGREFWPRFGESVRRRIAHAQFESWLAPLRCYLVDRQVVEMIAATSFKRDWIESHYLEILEEVAARVDGRQRRVRILLEADVPEGDANSLQTLAAFEKAAFGESGDGAPDAGPDGSSVPLAAEGSAGPSLAPSPSNPRRAPALVRQTPGSSSQGSSSQESPNPESLAFFDKHSDFVLNQAFTFDDFVTGSCNDLACASARAVAEFPGGPYNPLFIHGASGLGKTHLLQAICHAVIAGAKPRRILYLSCESFVNQFIQAVMNGDLEAFRYKYRKVDMLLIDDIQFLEGKTRTQEEFFHTFNTLHNGQRQIVISSDRPPSSIATLQDRLLSRFRWGMVTKIDKPCLETRIAILTRKARQRGVELTPEVAQCLAEHIDTNIRELEGAITRVVTYAEVVGRKLDLETVYEALRDLLPARAQVSMQAVLDLVSSDFGVLPKDLQSKRRMQSIVLPRQVGMYLARKNTRMSLEEIGGFFGGRDHSTVLHSIKKVNRLLGEDSAFAARVERLGGTLERG